MESESTNNEKELFDYKDRRISISDFEKEIIKLGKSSVQDTLDAVSEISNKNYLTFFAISRILRTVVTQMVKSKKFKVDDIENYLYSFVEIHHNQNNPESITRIGNLIKLYSLVKSINFLEDRLTYFQNIKSDRSKLFDMAIALSDLHFINKDYDNAFKDISRATFFVNKPTEQFDYLWKLKIINEKYAEICIKETTPKYDFFLIYYLVSFALEIARDLTAFPSLSPFYYRKKSQYSPDSGDDEDDYLNLSLRQLNILKHKKGILDEFNSFIYNELPIIYGIPLKYGEDTVRRIFDTMSTNYDEYFTLMRFSEELNKRSIDIIQYKTYEFVSKLLKEYYNKENP